MIKCALLLLSCLTIFAQRTPLSVNGTIVNNPNFTNTASLTWSVTGSNILGAAAGGGDTIWTNDNGTISATSTEGLRWQWNGTNKFQVNTNSELTLGPILGYAFLQDNPAIHLTQVRSLDGQSFADFSIQAAFKPDDLNTLAGVGQLDIAVNGASTDGGNNSYVYWEAAAFNELGRKNGFTMNIDGSADSIDWTFYSDEAAVTVFAPVAADGTTAYILNTAIAHTTGNLVEVKNAGDDRFSISHDGSGTFAGDVSVGNRLDVSSSARIIGAITNDALQASQLVYSSPTKVLSSISPGNSGDVLTSSGAGIAPSFLPNAAVPTSRTITAGNGMSGGGDLSANRTLTWAPSLWTSGTLTLGDSSQSSIVYTFGLSGATDPAFTAANNLITFGNPIAITGSANAVGLAVSGGSTTGSGTTKGGTFLHTLNTSGNVDGVWTFGGTDTASGSGTEWFTVVGGASGTTELFKVSKAGEATATGNSIAAGNVQTSGGHVVIVSGGGQVQIGGDTFIGRGGVAGLTAFTTTAGAAGSTRYGLHANHAVAPTIASAATIAPTTPVAFISGTTTIDTITAPSPISSTGGQITLIPTGVWATSTSGNIALITTAVVSKALIMTYDQATAKWYPSY